MNKTDYTRARPHMQKTLQYHDMILEQCGSVIKQFDSFNEEVNKLHEQNSHLYMRPIKIHEPPKSLLSQTYSPRRGRSIDPLPIALEHISNDCKYEGETSMPSEALEFRSQRTVSYYRRIQKRQDDLSQTVPPGNPRINQIPNTSSNVDNPKRIETQRRSRRLKMRQSQFESAQLSRPRYEKTVPRDFKTISEKPVAEGFQFPNLLCLVEHKETKRKIEQLEDQFQKSMRKSLVRIHRICRSLEKEQQTSTLSSYYFK